MKTICFYFQIHQPFRLRRYRFFDIGNNHYYYDDFQNEEIFHRISEKCYLPANRAIMEMIRKSGGKFKARLTPESLAGDSKRRPRSAAPPAGAGRARTISQYLFCKPSTGCSRPDSRPP